MMKILQVLFLILELLIFADAQSVSLTGSIYDTHGSVIQYATIKAKSKEGKEYSANSNEDGIYKFELPNGIYLIEFSANLFKNFTVYNYRISSDYKLKLNFDAVLQIRGSGAPLVKNSPYQPTQNRRAGNPKQ